MEDKQIVNMILLILTSLCICEVHTLYAQVSPTNPKEGDTAIFQCLEFGPRFPGSKIVWKKDGKELTRNDEFVDEVFGNRTGVSLHFDPVDFQLEVFLSIDNILRTDSGHYMCEILRFEDDLYDQYEFFVNVLYHPSEEFPICASNSFQNSTGLKCISEAGNPTVSLQWSVENSAKTDFYVESSQYETDGNITSEFSVINSQIRNTDVFTCSITSPEFSLNRSCSVYGSQLSHATILPSVMTVSNFGVAEFTCETNTEPVELVWEMKPQIPSSRQTQKIASKLRIDPVLEEDNGVIITCYALFDNNWEKGKAELRVTHNNQTETTTRISTEMCDKNVPLIVVFVIILVALVMSIIVNALCYRKIIFSELLSIKSGKVKPTNKEKLEKSKGDQEYTDLNFGTVTSAEYTGLNLGSTSASYVNRGVLGDQNQSVNDAELYECPEPDPEQKTKGDRAVYENQKCISQHAKAGAPQGRH